MSLELRPQEQDVEVVSGPAKFHLRTLRSEDFPNLPAWTVKAVGGIEAQGGRLFADSPVLEVQERDDDVRENTQ